MAIRTDLAAESEIFKSDLPEGVKQDSSKQGDIEINHIEIKNKNAANSIGKPEGTYITIQTPNMLSPQEIENEQKVLSDQLGLLLPKEGTVLIIGLGNEDITPDAVGPKTAEHILATRHFKGELADSLGLSSLRSVAVIAPGVLGQTGMESSEIIKSLCSSLNPSAVIAIDALAARSVSRLGSTIQISDTGISPGSGVENTRQELSKNTLGVPVIAIGIPTVVDLSSIISQYCEKLSHENMDNMMVTPRDVDRLIAKSALLISGGINKTLFPNLSEDEMVALTSP